MRKQEIIQALTPQAALAPITEEALVALPAYLARVGVVPIFSFPFRIGRESRVRVDEKSGRLVRMERTMNSNVSADNDLYLVDSGHRLNISRSHLSIERIGQEFVVVDRQSACGCQINEDRIGGHDKGGEHALQDGDELTIGTPGSPYRFRFVVLESV